jgi:putative intracellular protease/amidase
MVLVGEVEPAVSDLYDELADADVISIGGGDFGTLAASRWPKVVRFVRSRRVRIIGVPVLAGAVAAGTLLATDSQPPNGPGPPAQQIVITSTAVGGAGVAGPGGWVGSSGCRRGRSCPRG